MPHFQPKDRVTVPGIGDHARVSATVVLTLPRGNSSVLVHVDGDPDERTECHAVEDVKLLDAESAYHAHDQDADHPAECEVCGAPTRQGFGNYCSDAHRKIMDGTPTMQDQALDL